MFALVAFVCFLLALFHVKVGDIDLVVAGLMFIALHLFYGWGAPYFQRFRANPNG